MNIIEKILPDNQYIKEATPKFQIVLHHTVGSDAEGTYQQFLKTKERIATAYVVDKDGTIVKLFEPKYWAYHIGRGSLNHHNRKSIGIEIVNEGGLIKKGKEYYWFDGKLKYKGEVLALEEEYRGYKYFAKYTEAQIQTVNELVAKLCKEFKIPHKVVLSRDYKQSYFDFYGIVSHSNLRMDKSDVSPDFNLDELQAYLLKGEENA